MLVSNGRIRKPVSPVATRCLPLRRARLLASALLALAVLAVTPSAGPAGPVRTSDSREISARRAAERKTFTDAEIADGFFRIALAAEYHVAGRTDRIRKYDGPVRVYLDNRARPDRSAQMADVVADLRKRIRHLDIELVRDRAAANVVVTLVRDRDLGRTLRAFYGRSRARQIQRELDPQCLSAFRKDDAFRITRSDVIIVADAGEFVFYDCAYEELLQALGPINDDPDLPWSMFNDDVQMGFFDVFDQYLLNILYDPRIRPGMTAEQVRALLPAVLPDVRAWVAEVNQLPAE
jgi:hypothetical protein